MKKGIFIVTALAFAVIYGLSGFWGQDNWAYNDQIIYHLPHVNLLSERNFNPFGPSLSATTPGGHIVYGALALVTGAAPLAADSWLLAALGSLIAAATLGFSYHTFLHLSNKWAAAPLLLLPIVSSQYFLLPSAYFVTEGLSYLSLAVFFAMTQSRLNPFARKAIAAAALSALVLTRQIYLPVSMVMMMVFLPNQERWSPAFLVRQIGWSLIPLLCFLPFFLHWSGLVPPEFNKHETTGINLSAPLQSIALLGLFAIPLLPAFWNGTERQSKLWAAFGSGLALLPMALFAPSDFNTEAGRGGSLIWSFAKIERGILATSLSVYLLYALGALVLTYALFKANQTIRLAGIGYIVYSLALAMQNYSWQRYSEFFAIFTVTMIAAKLFPGTRLWHSILFALFFGAYLLATFIMRLS